MAMDKSLLTGSTELLILKLLEQEDMYGYQMIDTLREQSDHTFDLKAGTLYPLLHTLEQKGYVEVRVIPHGGRDRRYYHLTKAGKGQLEEKEKQWYAYTRAVNRVLKGGVCYG